MTLVLQCAMCGTHHPLGTPACATCRASGVPQLRLMFECPACGGLGLNPVCAACPAVVPLDLDDGLIVAEEVPGEEFDELVPLLELGEDEGDEALIVGALVAADDDSSVILAEEKDD